MASHKSTSSKRSGSSRLSRSSRRSFSSKTSNKKASAGEQVERKDTIEPTGSSSLEGSVQSVQYEPLGSDIADDMSVEVSVRMDTASISGSQEKAENVTDELMCQDTTRLLCYANDRLQQTQSLFQTFIKVLLLLAVTHFLQVPGMSMVTH